MFFLRTMFGLSLRIFVIFAKQSSFFRMAKALSNVDFWLTSSSMITTFRRSQWCHNGLFTIAWNKGSVQLLNLPYLGISAKVASQRYKSDLEKISSNKKNADISLKWSAKLQEIEVGKSKKTKQQESVEFLRKQVEAGMINADKSQDCLLFL